MSLNKGQKRNDNQRSEAAQLTFLLPLLEFPDLVKEQNTDIMENMQVGDTTSVIKRELEKAYR